MGLVKGQQGTEFWFTLRVRPLGSVSDRKVEIFSLLNSETSFKH